MAVVRQGARTITTLDQARAAMAQLDSLLGFTPLGQEFSTDGDRKPTLKTLRIIADCQAWREGIASRGVRRHLSIYLNQT